ncbi:hypothetical protein SmJEL517_g02496 [Synchytrium microbalum]|uniref:PPPDE domain-containing protein n=1 Tax=Synchytrium microbalum TaxID=1806994 RepID=A0A507C657_9FUNG|nr:uncharacterized protein SmJEL517_g02496 [Synchytrium microbalum]TPX34991.1 hypothetical protein SmJEL517_g02496 [Synchytrium microbalum]
MADVQLYVYDISNGMARSLSLMLTGQHFDAIYHTAVVIFGTEYFFGGGGIEGSTPGGSPFGNPLEVVDMGQTHIPHEVVMEYIDSLRGVYTGDKYHLLDSNCNDFSNALCQFLVGKTIPDHILSLPANFLSTPFGNQLRPMIENMFGASRHPTAVSTPSAAAPANGQSSSLLQNIFTMQQLEPILAQNRCVVLDFTSQTCGPCRMIAPHFENLIQESINYKPAGVKQTTNTGVVGVKIETPMSQSIASHYNVNVTPTFIFILDGKVMSQFKGADVAELKSSINLLQFSAYPPHKHGKVATPILDSFSVAPITFSASTSLDAIFSKLQGFLGVDVDVNFWNAIKESMKTRSPLPSGWNVAIQGALEKLAPDQVFPLLDIIRLLVLDPIALQTLISEGILVKTVSKYGSGKQIRAVSLMVLRVGSNMFATANSTNYITSTQKTTFGLIPRQLLTSLLVDSLLHEDPTVHQASASLAFNLARYIHESYPDCDEDFACEIVAGVSQAVAAVKDEETILRLLAALGLLIKYAPETVLELCRALEVEGVVKSSTQSFNTSSKAYLLSKELNKMLEL